MRILLPSATIAVLTGSCRPSLASATSAVSADADEQITNDGNDVAKSQVARDVDVAYESSGDKRRSSEKECNSFKKSFDKNKKTITDVGILGCGENQTCVPDETSAVGGRCAAATASSLDLSGPRTEKGPQTPRVAAFRKRRKLVNQRQQRESSSRNLKVEPGDRQIGTGDRPNVEEDDEDVPFVCPTNCPKAFCDCAENDGDAEVCAPELHDVCTQDLLAECVPDKYLPFYEKTYCPFAACLAVEKRPYVQCSCDYYLDYCDLYYAFEESVDKCAISSCCEGEAIETKFTCLPALEPTESPTMAPTFTFPPSASPTRTTAPTATVSPTSTHSPTFAPSMTTAPTKSSAPTPIPTESPSGSPTRSSEPTSSPTKPPTTSPTEGPTVSPTAFPSASPSYPPSASPSAAPTSSAEPTNSFPPTLSPSFSQPPTVTTKPSTAPTGSAAPTFPPSLSPTTTQPPSSSPSTPPPTENPTVGPTGAPTVSPTKNPTAAPQTPVPTTEPVTEEPTKGSSATEGAEGGTENIGNDPAPVTVDKIAPPSGSGGGIGPGPGTVAAYSLFAGVGGALWLLFA